MTTLRRRWTCRRGGRFGFGSRDSTGRFDVRDFLCFVFCFLMSRSRRSIAGILTASSCHLPFDRSCLPNQPLAEELTLGTCWWAMGCYPPRQPGRPESRPCALSSILPISRSPFDKPAPVLPSRPLKTSLRARAKGEKKRPQSAEDPGEDRIEARRSAAQPQPQVRGRRGEQ